MINTQDVDGLPGTEVLDSEGTKVGDVAQVYLSDDGAEPLFVTVKTGLFGTKETFIPLDSATLAQGVLHVRYAKEAIKDAPRVEADEHLSDAEQDSLFDYYDRYATGTPAAEDASFVADRDADRGVAASGVDTASQVSRGTAAGDASFGADRGVAASGVDTASQVPGGTTADDAMTLSEERLKVGVQQVQTGRARLRKHIVTEQQTVTVPVRHDEVRIEREPITDADAAVVGGALSEEEHEVVLTEERPVIDTEVVPVERVRLATETVTEQREVSAEVRHEELDTTGVEADDAAVGTAYPDGPANR